MKLFLASEGVPRPDLLRELLGLSSEKVKVALINNAQDTYPEDIARVREASVIELFVSLGFDPITIDLRQYEGKSEELGKTLRTCKLIWCTGGNVFWLRYVMKTSGFDKIVKDLLENGIVYGGWSAGAVVAGTSLSPIDLMDDPNEAPEIIWEGLGLINCFIWPHWDKEKYLSLQAEALQKIKLLGHESVILKDGDVLIVENDQKRLIQ